MDTELSDAELETIVENFWNISRITEDLQRDISVALTMDPEHRKKLSKRLKLSEEEMQKIFDRAVHTMVDAMPLATMNRCNLFTMLMAMHSNVTGDRLLHEVFRRLNQRALEAN